MSKEDKRARRRRWLCSTGAALASGAMLGLAGPPLLQPWLLFVAVRKGKYREGFAAKFLGAVIFNAVVWTIIPVHALIISLAGGQPAPGPLWCSYLAVVATGSLYISLGLIASALTRHQILAAFLAVVLLILIGVAPMTWQLVPDSWPTLRSVIRAGDLTLQVEEASRGLLDLVHLTYKVAFSCLFLLFTTRILEARKWA